MIHGIGTDIAGIRRMHDVHDKYGGKLAQRVLAPEEWGDYAQARDKDAFLAKRFAAKEALGKALGTGVRFPVMLTSISVIHDKLGRPGFSFAPELAAWIKSRGIGAVHLSLSDEMDYVVAFVLAEKA